MTTAVNNLLRVKSSRSVKSQLSERP